MSKARDVIADYLHDTSIDRMSTCLRRADSMLSTLRSAGLVVAHSGAIHKALQDAFQAGAIKAIEQHGISMPLGEDGLLPFLKAKHRYCDEELDRLIAASQEDK